MATGQGTIAMEIVQELPLVDYILVPIGGGGLARACPRWPSCSTPHQGHRRGALRRGLHERLA